MRTITLAAVAVTALLVLAATASRAEHASAHTVAIGAHHDVTFQSNPQAAPAVDDHADSRIDVQVWTLMAAGGAMALGLVLLGARVVLGWVKPPPSAEDVKH